jgi:hypothetical protein
MKWTSDVYGQLHTNIDQRLFDDLITLAVYRTLTNETNGTVASWLVVERVMPALLSGHFNVISWSIHAC